MRWKIKPSFDGITVITVPKITGIGQLHLKLSLQVEWYSFFATECRFMWCGTVTTGKAIKD